MRKEFLFSPQLRCTESVLSSRRLLYLLGFIVITLTGCAANTARNTDVSDQINVELNKATEKKSAPIPENTLPDAIETALLPPLQIEMPKSGKLPKQALEQKFDLAVNKAPAQQIFMDIVSGTDYSMLVHPEVSGTLSLNLKDVTVFEALDAIREMYGYNYKVEGNRIFIQSLTMQTRMFKINYITGQRKGSSEIRVLSGSVSDTSSPGSTTSGSTTTGGTTSHTAETSKIITTTDSDFWTELKVSLASIVGDKNGNNVVLNPHSGMVLIAALIHQ